MNLGRLLCATAPAMRPKLPLFTSVTGPLKNCAVLVAFRKSQRTSRLYRSLMRLFLIRDASRLRTPPRRTDDKRDDHVCNWNGCRISQTGCSPERQPRVDPFGSCVHVLNQRSRVRLESLGSPPVGTAPGGVVIGKPSCSRAMALTCQPPISRRTIAGALAP